MWIGKLCSWKASSCRNTHTNYEGLVKTIWLEFPDLPQIGKKLRRKATGYVAEINVSRMAVPIVLRSSNIPLNNNKTIFVKRTHVPLVCACATTVHKSQGNTYSEIVYENGRRHSQSLLYVALSRVTSIEGLYITTKNNDKTFYHCRRRLSSTIDLQEEFKRLSLNKLQTINEDLINFITNRQVLSETWLGNESDISIPNFNFIMKYKRPNTRAEGVAIHQNSSDAVNIITPSMECSVSKSDIYGTIQSSVGDLCLAECVIDNGQKL
ncbi:ATP-dependent DNA helicase [Trichonephila clavipes]|uniref:ATP-dependent DNA helicase n=1 Tax=Trichonephila clavipes TaxID=2585209 RepID=A0A8X6R124_TRICX|nr:ATP-dependent DNA helicase [Trichonephila clavipes]